MMMMRMPLLLPYSKAHIYCRLSLSKDQIIDLDNKYHLRGTATPCINLRLVYILPSSMLLHDLLFSLRWWEWECHCWLQVLELPFQLSPLCFFSFVTDLGIIIQTDREGDNDENDDDSYENAIASASPIFLPFQTAHHWAGRISAWGFPTLPVEEVHFFRSPPPSL